MNYSLVVKNLTKRFNGITAVDNVSFEVPDGSIFGLIGRNGAGKTTTIRMMMGIYLPDDGEIVLRGVKVGQEFKNKVGYLPEERGLYKKMKVLDTILYFAELKGKSGKEIAKKAEDYLKKFDLYDRRNSKVEELSKGNQQKIQFITTILHDPDFIILDEPFSGLDPVNINILKDIILEMKSEGKVVILSTHLIDYAEKMCDYIAMIDHGRLILKGSISEIKSKYAQNNISLSCEGDISFLNNYSIIEKIENFGNTTAIRVKEANHIQELLKLIVEKNIVIKKFIANDISLHEIFIELTGKDDENETSFNLRGHHD